MRRRRQRAGVRRPGVSHPDSMLRTSSVMSSEVSMQGYPKNRMQQTLDGCRGQRSAASTSRVSNVHPSPGSAACCLVGGGGAAVRLTSNQPQSFIGTPRIS